MQVRDGDPAFAAGDRHTRTFMSPEPASHSLHSRQETPLQRRRRSRPDVRAVDNRDIRTQPRGMSQGDGMFVAGRDATPRFSRLGGAYMRSTLHRSNSSARQLAVRTNSYDRSTFSCAPAVTDTLPARLRPTRTQSSTPGEAKLNRNRREPSDTRIHDVLCHSHLPFTTLRTDTRHPDFLDQSNVGTHAQLPDENLMPPERSLHTRRAATCLEQQHCARVRAQNLGR